MNTCHMPDMTPEDQKHFTQTIERIKERHRQNPTIYKTGPTKYQDGVNKGHWTQAEDKLLEKAVKRFQGRNWKKIAEELP